MRTMIKLLSTALLGALLASPARAAEQIVPRVYLPLVTMPARIVFESRHGPNDSRGWLLRQIYSANSDGSDPRLLSTSEQYSDYAPIWSPGGDRIAFLSMRGGVPQVYLMRPDGSDQTRLTSAPHGASLARWSPDGTRLAFKGSSPPHLYLINTDGSGLRELTTSPIEQFDWAPDGTWLVYSTPWSEASGAEVRVVRTDDGQPHDVKLYESSQPIEYVDWSPDGTRIAFPHGAPSSGGLSLTIINTDGSPAYDPTDATFITGLAWSPDSSSVVLSSSNGVALINAKTSERQQIVSNSGGIIFRDPDWSPDGSQIVLHELGGLSAHWNAAFQGLRIVHMNSTNTRILSHLRPDQPSWSR